MNWLGWIYKGKSFSAHHIKTVTLLNMAYNIALFCSSVKVTGGAICNF